MDDSTTAWALAGIALVLVILEGKRITKLERTVRALLDDDQDMLKLIRDRNKLEAYDLGGPGG